MEHNLLECPPIEGCTKTMTHCLTEHQRCPGSTNIPVDMPTIMPISPPVSNPMNMIPVSSQAPMLLNVTHNDQNEGFGQVIWILVVISVITLAIGIVIWCYVKQNRRNVTTDDNIPLMYDADELESSISKKQENIIPVANDIPFENLTIEEKLGEGSYGEVFKGKWGGLTVALKKLKSSAIGQSNILQEAKTLAYVWKNIKIRLHQTDSF
jgi:hypothetical protein